MPINWTDVLAVLATAKPYAKGVKGMQKSTKAPSKSRATVWNEAKADTFGKAGDIGTGNPLYADPAVPKMDPNFRLAQRILREFSEPQNWPERDFADIHEEIP